MRWAILLTLVFVACAKPVPAGPAGTERQELLRALREPKGTHVDPPVDVSLTTSGLHWNGTEIDADPTRLAMWASASRRGEEPGHSFVLHVSEDVPATRMLSVIRALASGGYLRYRVQVGAWVVDLDLAALEGRVEGANLGLWLQGGTWRVLKEDDDQCERTTFPAADAVTAMRPIVERPIAHLELVAADGTALELGPVLTQVAQGHRLRLGVLTPAETDFPAVCLKSTGTMPTDTLRDALETHHGAIVRCIAPSGGVVSVAFTLDPSGKIIDSGIDSANTSIYEVDLNLCVLTEFRKITFPAPTGGTMSGGWRFRLRR